MNDDTAKRPISVEHATIPKKISEAVLKTQKDLGTLGKDDQNPFGNFSYVSIDKYYEVVAAAANKNGLSWFCHEVGSKPVMVNPDAEKGMALKFDYLFTMFHSGGECVPSYDRISIYHPIQGAQTSGSAASYAEKLFMRKAFKVVTGEQDADAMDGDAFGGGQTTPGGGHPITVVGAAPAPVPIQEQVAPVVVEEPKETPSSQEEPSPPETPPEPPQEEEPSQEEPSQEEPEPEQDNTPEPQSSIYAKTEMAEYADENEDGIIILKPIKNLDKTNWDLVIQVFNTFIPNCSDQNVLKEFWRKNDKTLNMLKDRAPNKHAELVEVFKAAHTALGK